jgi:hypothetical protein
MFAHEGFSAASFTSLYRVQHLSVLVLGHHQGVSRMVVFDVYPHKS